jgi:hypothetical protein
MEDEHNGEPARKKAKKNKAVLPVEVRSAQNDEERAQSFASYEARAKEMEKVARLSPPEKAMVEVQGRVDRGTRELPRKESRRTNGLGIANKGPTQKLVATAAAEKQGPSENKLGPSYLVLFNLAGMWMKKRSPHFYHDSMRTMNIICQEFGYSLQNHTGMRWFSVSWSSRGNGCTVHYERSITGLDQYLKETNKCGSCYQNLSALVDKLFAEMNQPTITYGSYGSTGRKNSNPDSFRAKINLMTEYIHLAYIVLHTVFGEMTGLETPDEKIVFLNKIFGNCKTQKSMAAVLYDFAVVYDSFAAIMNCKVRPEAYRTNPEMIADDLHSRAGGFQVDVVLPELEEKLRKSLTESGKGGGKSGKDLVSSWLIARYRICLGYSKLTSKDKAPPLVK